MILPIALCQTVNVLGLEEIRFLGITLPRLTANRQDTASILGGGLAQIRDNFMFLLGILHNGDDGHLYNALPLWRGGVLYFFGLPLAAAGIFLSMAEHRERSSDWPMAALLGSSLLCAMLIRGNINRLNMLWLPMIYFGAVALERMVLFTWNRRRLLTFGMLSGVLVCFLGFIYFYVPAFAAPGNEDYFPGLGQAIQAAEKRNPDLVYVTDEVSEPYIFSLFYSQTEPEVFIRTVEYENPNIDFRPVERFRSFEFRDPERCDLLVLSLKETEGREILETYGDYALCSGQGIR